MGLAVLAALLAVGGVALARARNDTRDRGTDRPVEVETAGPLPGVTTKDSFGNVTVVARPGDTDVDDVLLHNGEPAFVVGHEGTPPSVVAAFGGPAHARLLVGWCAPAREFHDETGTYRYDSRGAPVSRHGDSLPVHPVRSNGTDLIDIGEVGVVTPYDTGAEVPGQCSVPLRYPRLPARVGDVHDTIQGFRVVTGRYVASTDTRSFCAPVTAAGCATQGWEEYGLGSLPPGDLAGSYTWEGDFLVRGDRDGHLSAVRLPGVAAPKRTDVGASAVRGLVEEVSTSDPLTVILDNRQQIVVPREADVFLGRGRTGLGRPAGTAVTLREFLLTTSGRDPFWFVLDGNGQAIRVVVEV